MTPARPVWCLVALASPRARALAAATAALAFIARLAVVATSFAVVGRSASSAAVLAAIAAAAFGAERAAQNAARIVVESDLLRATVRSLLETDLVEVHRGDTQRIIYDGAHHGTDVVAVVLPRLAADSLAAAVLAPFALATFPPRVLAVAVIALFTVLATTVAVRGRTRTLQARLVNAQQAVGERVLVAVAGRLDLVASGNEDRFRRGFDEALDRYRHLAHRSGLASALLGRAPLVMGAFAVVGAISVDAAARDVVASTAIAQAVVLAAYTPPLLGAVLGVNALTRAIAHIEPFVERILEPPRPDVHRKGRVVPRLPATVRADAVHFTYPGSPDPLLSGVAFEWSQPTPLVVTGPNGSGKSTLLRLLIGLHSPTAGTISLGGDDIEVSDVRALRKSVAYLPQRPYLGEEYTSVRDAMKIACPDADDAAMTKTLERSGLSAALDAPVGELSSGQRQRVALARVLLQDASLVLLDEPDANLDREGIELVARLVDELVQQGKMVAVAAHSSELAAIRGLRLDLGAGDE